ncbi:SDR family NAD(P)-dependent oxidoreductase [Paenibacillus beijingensis]|uniref:Oxidoreductase n=1 Tax=Paenibacillus beijingensis TaxID=1126833 RepID=A0A0D5NF99_9BACL|nr:SDR family oxidoreductase [Paenibacillus beijingensis]AJY73627.1 oxidoreductase [Paenibacillus beijingensis]
MIKDKVIMITGASSGIGALTARKLAQRGAVPVLCARSLEKLEQASAAIAGSHGRYVLDVTDEKGVNETVAQIMKRYGRIDALINNAGFGRFKPFMDAPIGDFSEMMNTNYMGIVRCTKAVLPHMAARGQGHIVNIASMAGKIGTPKSTGYTASKHAVLGLTNALRHELRGSGVFVSAVNPGPIDTPFFEQADPSGSYVRNVKRFMMTPDKVADRIAGIIERPRAELDLPWLAAAGIKLYQLFPRLADRIAGPMLDRK